ncbi:MAG: Aspartyl/glutamyl-tRNA(Asn/Gln) amidotransferase subunit B [bacterium ADurb.Bin212]|nr:MAG: Aspartyl/glutamyl-tRNA(Asn/Gln) amidotransferase subunit B [bacterium ADurb.Bin212]
MEQFKTTIGLEIHVQLATNSKMFCRCDNVSEKSAPNTNVCPRCLGMPGTLPVANRQAIEWTIKTGLALNCEIPEESKFDRKHYFYPDLPKGYQISQYDQPLCKGGWLEIQAKSNNQKTKKIILNRIHLEEDAGKLVHKGKDSLVDLNRASTPLMEIVTEPCIESPAEAREFLQELQLLIRYLKVSEASMEKGHLRCDANISISDKPKNNNQKSKMSEIVEIKNLNSFKFVEKALEYEEKRLREEYKNWPDSRKKVTRGFDSDKGVTYEQRHKEEASDYRYFPEPDVPPIKVRIQKSKVKIKEGEFDLEEIKKSIGHLPHLLRDHLAEKQVPQHVADKIVNNPEHAWYLIDSENLEKEIATWVTEEVNAQISAHKISYEEYKKRVPITHLADLLSLVKAGKISTTAAKEVFSEMVATGLRALEIVESKGLEQISDDNELEIVVKKILSDNPQEAQRLKDGDKKLMGFFIGLIMKETQGRANPQVAASIINKNIF